MGNHRSIVLLQLYLASFKFNRETSAFWRSEEIAKSLKHRRIFETSFSLCYHVVALLAVGLM